MIFFITQLNKNMVRLGRSDKMAGWRSPCNCKKENNGIMDEGNRKVDGRQKNSPVNLSV